SASDSLSTGRTMPIPNDQSIMLPLLRRVADDKVHRVRDAVDHLEQHFGLSRREKRELKPDGRRSGTPQPLIPSSFSSSTSCTRRAPREAP
ncbi:MAG: hypothetical protein OXH04_10450, partial [Acidobacteria bacterium]|nr:hypothetical protein [Acidobacteriota bacterium]